MRERGVGGTGVGGSWVGGLRTGESSAGRLLAGGARAGGYLSLTFPLGLASVVSVPLLVAATMTIAAGGLGFVLLPYALAVVRQLADFQRRRGARWLAAPAPPPRQAMPKGVAARFKGMLRDRSTWRDVRWLIVQVVLGIPVGLVGLMAVVGPVVTLVQMALWWTADPANPVTILAIPVTNWGVALVAGAVQAGILVALFMWGTPALARFHAWVSVALLSPSEAERRAERLAGRVETLTVTRADALEAHAAELRRIERDLHDGTQARLVALAMRLGVAERALADDPETAARLLREARDGTEETMAELREVVRTIYPPILADRGIAGAVIALGAQSGVPADVQVEELGALPAAVEAAAYFVVAEALTNVTKHSSATAAWVRLTRVADVVRVEVTDNGDGGVDETRGSGVLGVRRRTAALDGRTEVSSPPGGPTRIIVELPCAS